ncbi:arginyl-tRNA--protein transferase 1 isoform X2 [Toxorhynchites rutilus septentrionalis]|uniref:arginyl-tRNA--protein transferase 1 isoform X2 n=1 Tax=Toxorhynchites rutilus septentrionalis TaxID=329112 RepID=UPI00247834D7|nr:arginyl-tRNA--protein transferase 1 isoform X2 [Toxorhynchites rutilus septentrionalis]
MFSIVDFYGKQANYSCGYCKQPKSCQSHGMWAHTMTCRDYQELIDRGWRRSGCYCYKPEMNTTCCPSYTIKCDAIHFHLNKSHKKIIKRMNKFLKDGIKGKERFSESDCNLGAGSEGECGDLEMGEISRNPRREINSSEFESISKKEEPIDAVDGLCVTKRATANSDSNLSIQSSPGNPNPRKKAKLLRIERKREKLIKNGISSDEIEQNMRAAKGKNVEKRLEDFLDEAPKQEEEAAHRLKVKLVPSSEGATDVSFALYCSYQMVIHEDPPAKLTMDRYKRFLVKSPFKFVGEQSATSCGFGSFHQQYWLDDRLIAVGVIDVLPKCVSSVYFFYDPEYRFLSLGTYGSLRELAFTRKLYQQSESISNYYMGFYIHSCPKMRYKSNLSPSYLLCPEAYTWHPLDRKVSDKLDKDRYSRLNEDSLEEDCDSVSSDDLMNVLVLHGTSYMRYSSYMESEELSEPDECVLTYAKLVGKSCATRMLLYVA